MKFSIKTMMMFALIGAGSAVESGEEDFSYMDNVGLDLEELDEEPSAVMNAVNGLRGRELEAKRKVCRKYKIDKYDFPIYGRVNWPESKIAEYTAKGEIVDDQECEANIGNSSKKQVCRKYMDKNYDAELYGKPKWTVQQVKQLADQVVDMSECDAKFKKSTEKYCFNSAKPDAPEWYKRQTLSENDIARFTSRKAYQTVLEDMSVCNEKLKKTRYCFTNNPREKEKDVRPARVHEYPNWDKQTYTREIGKIAAGKSAREEVPMTECQTREQYCVDYGKDGAQNLKKRNWTLVDYGRKGNFPKVVDMALCEQKEAEEEERKRKAQEEEAKAKAEAAKQRAEEQAAKKKAREDARNRAKLEREAENARRKAEQQAKNALRKDILVTRDLVRAQAEIDKYANLLDEAEANFEDGEEMFENEEITEKELKQLSNMVKAAEKEVKHTFRLMQKIQQVLQREAESAAKKAARAAKKARQAGERAKMKAAKQEARNKRKRARKPGKFPKIEGACFDDHVCARVSGDPHITTWDGLRYDCQGHGEFVLARSLESQFEIQGRFEDARSNTDGNMITITKAISIDTGVEGAPAVDIVAEEDPSGEKGCFLNYYIDGEPADFEKGLPAGVEFHDDTPGQGNSDLLYFPDSGITYSVMVRYGNFGCVLNNDICIPGTLAREETIVGLFGSPNNKKEDDWMDEDGLNLNHFNQVEDARGYTYCTENWCVSKNESIFGYLPDESWEDFYGCDRPYNPNRPTELIQEATLECQTCCGEIEDPHQKANCLLECVEGDALDCENFKTAEETFDIKNAQCEPKETPAPTPDTTDPSDLTTDQIFVKGDPHFKTFGGELYDYHGECDLVLLHNPEFKDNLGMDIHIRTKIEDFWSSVESAAIKIGDETLEIKASPETDEWLWINGDLVSAGLVEGQWNRASIGGMLVRFKSSGTTREANIYIEGDKEHLVLKTFKNFVRIDVDWKESENFNGSTGLLGSHSHNGARLGRDGQPIVDVNSFGQEWQVADEDPQLFHSYEGAVVLPNKCVLPPAFGEQSQLRKRRLANGMDVSVAEKACQHLSGDDFKACVFDVIATQDTEMASVW